MGYTTDYNSSIALDGRGAIGAQSHMALPKDTDGNAFKCTSPSQCNQLALLLYVVNGFQLIFLVLRIFMASKGWVCRLDTIIAIKMYYLDPAAVSAYDSEMHQKSMGLRGRSGSTAIDRRQLRRRLAGRRNSVLNSTQVRAERDRQLLAQPN